MDGLQWIFTFYSYLYKLIVMVLCAFGEVHDRFCSQDALPMFSNHGSIEKMEFQQIYSKHCLIAILDEPIKFQKLIL